MATTSEIDLTLESLASMGDGELGILFRNLMLRMSRDCMDRPGDKNARKLTIELQARPICDSAGQLHHVDTEVEMKLRIPTYRSTPYQLRATMNGMRVNQMFPDALNQQPLFTPEASTENDPDEEDDDEE